ncbi:Transportin-3, partial [Paragonimus kellicotti]
PGQKLAVGAALSALGSLSSVYRATASAGFNGVTASHLPSAGESTRTGLLDEHWPDLIQRVAYNLPRLAWVPVYDATHFFTGIGRGLISSIGSGGGGVDFDPHPARQMLPTRLAQICSVSLECLTKALGGPTLKMLHGPGLLQQPHTVEDLYRLCTRLVQHCAAVFLASEQVDLNELCDTAARSLNLCCTGPSAGLSGDDTSGPNSSSDDSSSSSANTSASAAAARFFIDLLSFTGEAAEVTPTQVVQILSSGGQLSTPSSPSSLGAQRVLIWLTNSTPCSGSDVADCGGQRLVSACLQACCLGYSEERFPELADIIHHLKVMTKNELFLKWLTTAVTSLPILRSDGLVHATVDQIADFKDVIMNSSRSSAIVHALTSFSSLFR